MREKLLVMPILMILILSIVPILGGWDLPNGETVTERVVETPREYRTSYVVHSPITIDDNTDFVTQSWPGNGSESNPYRIENLNITGTMQCISIRDVTVYYVVSNCLLESSSTMYGTIEIRNAPNGIIEDVLTFGGDDGISMIDSPGSRIENCTFTNADWVGVYVGSSDGTSIIDVEVSGSQSGGIRLYTSDRLLVQNCTIYDIDYTGMNLNSLTNSEIRDCEIFSCGHIGMDIRSQDCIIAGNEIHDNGRPGIDPGMSCYQANNCTIIDNDVYNIPEAGIYFSQSVACNATGNRVHDNYVGIAASNSQGTIISHNRVFNNGWVVGMESGVWVGWSMDTLVSHNWISNNTWDGVYSYLSNGSRIEYNEVYDNEVHNIYYLDCHHSNMTGNIVGGSSTGAVLIDSSDARITDNIIYDSTGFGLQLQRTDSSWVYQNDMAWNGFDVWNARESDCTGIHWDNNVTDGVGNWWGDYDGSPTYVLQYGDGGIDHFPHISLNASEAAPIEYEYGTTGNIMNWTQASARNPSHYEVYADGVLFENVTWDGLHIEVDVDSLDVGYYEMNLTVYHITGHSASSVSYANVTDTTSPTWDVVPTDQVAEYGDHFMYNVSASDLRGIVHYTLNDTSYFSISSEGSITNTSLVPVGIHRLEVRAYDPSSLSCVASITISVSDSLSPTWTMIIEDQVLEFGDSFSYQLGAIDISGIQNWFVNDSIHFTIVDGLITNNTALKTGIYYLNVSIQDVYGNTLFELFTITVSDTIAPTWTMSPVDQVLEYGESLSYQLGASDLSGIGIWQVNDTAHFAIVDGLLTNLGTLEAGVYFLNVTVQDMHGNSLSVVITVTVQEEVTTPTTPTTSTTTTTPPDGGIDTNILLIGGVGAAVGIVLILVGISKKRGD